MGRDKIVILDARTINYGDLSWDCLSALGDVTAYDFTAPEEVVERSKDATILLGNKIKMPAAVLAQLPKLRLYCCMATGFNDVDIEAAREQGVVVCNVPAYSTASVVQLTIGLITGLALHIKEHDAVARKEWQSSPMFNAPSAPMMELEGKTLGIIGYGSIGSHVAKVAEALGMHVLVHSHHCQTDGERYVDLATLLAQSDVVSLHCALNDATRHLVDAERLGMMKDGAILVNTARGMVVDDAALYSALVEGKLAGYAADVQTLEPPSRDCVLLRPELEHKTLFTPHIGFATREARARLVDVLRANIHAFQEGRPQNVVN